MRCVMSATTAITTMMMRSAIATYHNPIPLTTVEYWLNHALWKNHAANVPIATAGTAVFSMLEHSSSTTSRAVAPFILRMAIT